MPNKYSVLFLFFTLICIVNVSADNVNFTLEITGINVNEGQIHVRIYSNERDYRRDVPYLSLILESSSQIIIHRFDIMEGEYLFALFQDTNNNGQLDTNLFGFPREPVGLSRYTGGIPGGFNRHKFQINNNSNRITINMGRV